MRHRALNDSIQQLDYLRDLKFSDAFFHCSIVIDVLSWRNRFCAGPFRLVIVVVKDNCNFFGYLFPFPLASFILQITLFWVKKMIKLILLHFFSWSLLMLHLILVKRLIKHNVFHLLLFIRLFTQRKWALWDWHFPEESSYKSFLLFSTRH